MELFKIMEEVKFKLKKPWSEIKNTEIKDIAYNSSKCEKGYIFVAIKGESVDGHKYVQKSYDRGCRTFILQDDIKLPKDATKILVEDSRIALSKMSSNFFGSPSTKLKIIGVTGTKGKTTITNYISEVLNKANLNTGIIGTNGTFYNGKSETTENTTPESYELHRLFKNMLDEGVECVAMEVSSGGVMMNRVKDVDFDVAILSNISHDHVGDKEHPTFEHYLECKAELLTWAKHSIVNIDDKYGQYFIKRARHTVQTFGIKKEADIKAIDINYTKNRDTLGVDFKCKIKDEKFNIYINSPGTFSIYNALAVIGVCRYLEIKENIMIEALKSARVKGRVEVLPILPYATLIIDYAHNGDSLQNILRTLKTYNPKRLICLFGSVGGRSHLRRKELGDVAARECDLCVLTSDNPDYEDPINIIKDIEKSFKNSDCECLIEPDRKIAIEKVIQLAKEGDMILLAGKGHEEYQLIKGEKIPFCEAEIVKNIVNIIGKNKI